MDQPAGAPRITAVFGSRREADSAVAALAEIGISASSTELRERDLLPVREREGRYLRRLLVIIVAWSVVGGAMGAGFGALLAAMIGPEGTTGLIFQVVCWMIIGHLLIGMIAGYVVLADRSYPEMEPERPEVVLSVQAVSRDVARVHAALRSSGGKRIVVSETGEVTSRR